MTYILTFTLGVAVGVILIIAMFYTHSRYKRPTVRLARQIQSKTQAKGAILDVSRDETDEWLDAITTKN